MTEGIWIHYHCLLSPTSGSLCYQWEFQDPNTSVLHHMSPYFQGMSSYIRLTWPCTWMYMVGTSNQSVPAMAIDYNGLYQMIWRFPEIGLQYPSHHPIIAGSFHYKPSILDKLITLQKAWTEPTASQYEGEGVFATEIYPEHGLQW